MGELPEPWNTAAEKAGVRQTFRGISEAAGGISHVTVKRLITGGPTSAATIRKVAGALGVTQEQIGRWIGMQIPEWGMWDPPASAHQMSPRVRSAVEELIRAVTEERGQPWGQVEPGSEDDGGGTVVPGNFGGPKSGPARRAARKARLENQEDDHAE